MNTTKKLILGTWRKTIPLFLVLLAAATSPTSFAQTSPDVSFDTAPQSFVNTISISLSTSSDQAEIRYTTDGSLPTLGSLLYTDAFTLDASTLVRARTYQSGLLPGEIKSEAYMRLSTEVSNQTSNLPVIVLENFDTGAVPKGTELQAAYFALYEPDPVTGRTSFNSLPTKANRAGIKRRGSSTLNDPKGNYRVELWQDDSEEDRSLNLLDLSDHDEWILSSPYRFDRALMRIPFIQDISNDIGRYAPKTRFVELYLNTGGTIESLDYQGVYVLQERISRDKNRVDINKLDETDISGEALTGGYILSIDRVDPGEQGFLSSLGHPFPAAADNNQQQFTYVYPKESNILSQQGAYIRGYIDDLESALYGANFKDPELGYRAWINVAESIDYHILKTFSKDPDALRLSTYLYKPRNGKLAFGPLWDFDRAMGCDDDSRSTNPANWYESRGTDYFGYDYWERLFEDPDFSQQWTDRWQELRRSELSDASMTSRLSAFASELTESAPRNTARWPAVSPNGGPLTNLSGWEGEVDHLKNWVKQRAAWIDSQFTAPPQLQASAAVLQGTSISTQFQADSLYYTTDGSDPRLAGGGVNSSALSLSGSGAVSTTLVSEASTAIQALKPSSSSPGPTAWTETSFAPTGWQSGNFAVGYDYSGIDINVSGNSGAQPTSVYIRAPFTLLEADDYIGLTLRVKYDDGFVAYLNGNRIESRNAPTTTAWNSSATSQHSDAQAVNFINFDVSAHIDKLIDGPNVLAIHALNTGTANSTNTGSTSSDMLLSAELIGLVLPSQSSIVINETTTITARSFSSTGWSGSVQSTFVVGTPANASNLVVSEIMYHPAAPTSDEITAGFTTRSHFEYLELENVSDETIDLSGVTISQAFNLQLQDNLLAAKQVAVIARNQAAFQFRYGNTPNIVGEYGDSSDPEGGSKLDNGGEAITITGVSGQIIQNFSYDDDPLLSWPTSPDGDGPALILRAPLTLPDHDIAPSWRSGLSPFGGPGFPSHNRYQEWASFTFSLPDFNQALISQDSADPDNDGLSNYLEFALGGNPYSPSPELRPLLSIETDQNSESHFTLSIRRNQSVDGVLLSTEFSEDLISWDNLGLLFETVNFSDGSQTLIYRSPLSTGLPKQFGRIRISEE